MKRPNDVWHFLNLSLASTVNKASRAHLNDRVLCWEKYIVNQSAWPRRKELSSSLGGETHLQSSWMMCKNVSPEIRVSSVRMRRVKIYMDGENRFVSGWLFEENKLWNSLRKPWISRLSISINITLHIKAEVEHDWCPNRGHGFKRTLWA